MKFPHTAIIKSLESSAGGGSEYGSGTTKRCFLQPLRDEKTDTYGSVFTQGYRCYFPHGTTISSSDMVEINSEDYTVKGTSPRPYGGLKHVEVLLEKK